MFPEHATEWHQLQQTLHDLKALDFNWRHGRVPGIVHYYNDETQNVVERAYTLFMPENGLGAGKAFPSLARLESELQSMVLNLFAAPPTASALFTSGGTESLLLAVKAARDLAVSRGILRPNAVAGLSAHPALNKAGELFGVEIRRVALTSEYRIDITALGRAVDAQTALVFGSAPCYPYGVFDDIGVLAKLARERSIWFHVDACWGGFVSPFARDLGYRIPPFDFEVAGVTSLSADLHKYAYAAKGMSALCFRESDLAKLVGFRFEWVRGVYETPTLAGSRPGGALAAAWAVLRFLGRDGYRKAISQAMDATVRLRQGISAIPGLRVIPVPVESNIFCFVSDDSGISIDAVADVLKSRGWYPGRIKEPLGIHHAVTPMHAEYVDEYLSELRAATEEVKRRQLQSTFDAKSY
jgi:sphinganine-1-phosphate aldolase